MTDLMQQRQIGLWYVTWGVAEDYVVAWGEDGPYTRRVPYVLLTATREYGDLYAYRHNVGSLEQARTIAEALPTSFDPRTDTAWNFARNTYGSEAYQDNWQEEEYDRMDEVERRHYRR